MNVRLIGGPCDEEERWVSDDAPPGDEFPCLGPMPIAVSGDPLPPSRPVGMYRLSIDRQMATYVPLLEHPKHHDDIEELLRKWAEASMRPWSLRKGREIKDAFQRVLQGFLGHLVVDHDARPVGPAGGNRWAVEDTERLMTQHEGLHEQESREA